MQKVIDAAILDNGRVWLVNKKGTFILPGGKPEKSETPLETIVREIEVEELPGTKLNYDSLRFYRTFQGISPFRKARIEADVYLMQAIRMGEPSQEISGLVQTNKFYKYPLSQITADIFSALQNDGHIYF